MKNKSLTLEPELQTLVGDLTDGQRLLMAWKFESWARQLRRSAWSGNEDVRECAKLGPRLRRN
jgi:hypothetical protein